MNSKQEQSEAEKAAEEYFLSMMEDIPGDIGEVPPTTLHIPIKEVPVLIRNAFLAGAAWAAPKWIKCSEEPPPDEMDFEETKRLIKQIKDEASEE